MSLRPSACGTQIEHPALPYVLALLESMRLKEMSSFARCFDLDGSPFLDTLPGGVQIRSARELVKKHEEFFGSSIASFTYQGPQDLLTGESFFICSVPASVVRPNGSHAEIYLDLTFIKWAGRDPEWVPVRFINTVVDCGQVVIH